MILTPPFQLARLNLRLHALQFPPPSVSLAER